MSARTLMMVWALVLGLGVLGPAVAEASKSRTQYTGVVNLNSGTAEELDRLPGVGPSAVERIIAYRQKHPFKRPEELVRVKGFGKKKFQKLQPLLTTSNPTTLKVERGGGSGAPKKKRRRARH